MKNLIKSLWILLSLGILHSSLWLIEIENASDGVYLLVWGMVALTFPIGLLVGFGWGALAYIYYSSGGEALESSLPELILLWLVFFAAGYMQWFNWLPQLIKRFFKGHRSKPSPNRA